MLIRTFGCYVRLNPNPANCWDLITWVSRDERHLATRIENSKIDFFVQYLEAKGFRKIVIESV